MGQLISPKPPKRAETDSGLDWFSIGTFTSSLKTFRGGSVYLAVARVRAVTEPLDDQPHCRRGHPHRRGPRGHLTRHPHSKKYPTITAPTKDPFCYRQNRH